MEYPVIERLNPKSRFPYICESEKESEDRTVFYLKSLSILEYRSCEESIGLEKTRYGAFGLMALRHGLVGWDNLIDDDGRIIPFDFSNIDAIPYMAQLELSAEIINIAEVSDELTDELKLVTKWADWIDHNKRTSDQWECGFCIEKKLPDIRNCTGNLPNKCPRCQRSIQDEFCEQCMLPTKPQFVFRFSNVIGDHVSRCPVSLITERALRLTNIINYIDSSKALPFSGGALEQTAFYYTSRIIVLSEQNALLKKELDKTITKKPTIGDMKRGTKDAS